MSQLDKNFVYHKKAQKAIKSIGPSGPNLVFLPQSFALILPLVLSLSIFKPIDLISKGEVIFPLPQMAQPNTDVKTPVPDQVAKMVSNIDSTANRRDLKELTKFYSEKFTNSDGLNLAQFTTAIQQIWQRYDTLKYQTKIESWQSQGATTIIIETVTTIEGKQKLNKTDLKLISTIRSKQIIENEKIVNQEILSETTQLTSGKKPPTVKLSIPATVKVGENYNLDAIVEEPVGNDILLGAVLAEAVSVEDFLQPTAFQLELLSAGGLFKIAQAPTDTTNLWVSAILMRQGGITLISQRLKVIN